EISGRRIRLAKRCARLAKTRLSETKKQRQNYRRRVPLPAACLSLLDLTIPDQEYRTYGCHPEVDFHGELGAEVRRRSQGRSSERARRAAQSLANSSGLTGYCLNDYGWDSLAHGCGLWAGRVHRQARVAHGRTRMIVFPLRRSVGFKAATASSRVETVPMFVRSRPSRTR